MTCSVLALGMQSTEGVRCPCQHNRVSVTAVAKSVGLTIQVVWVGQALDKLQLYCEPVSVGAAGGRPADKGAEAVRTPVPSQPSLAALPGVLACFHH